MEPGDITDLAKTSGTAVSGLTIGHLTGNDLVVIATLIYLAFQCIVLAPRVTKVVRGWFNKLRGRNGETDS